MGYSFYEDTKKDSGAVRKTALNTPQRPGSIDVKSLQIDVFPYDAFEFSDPGKIANPVLSLKDRWTFDGASIKVGSITADKIDVDSLFAQQITVPDGGRIRYETGAGVQKRCVQLADEKIDWLDTPDTTPASPEILRARIGRLGVGGDLLLDGTLSAPCDGAVSSASLISSDALVHTPRILQRANGDAFIFYASVTNNISYMAPYDISTGAIGTRVSIVSPNHAISDVIEDSSGVMRALLVAWTSTGYTYESIYNDSTDSWGALTLVISGDISSGARYCEYNGSLYIFYGSYASTSGYYWRSWDGSALGSALVVKSGFALNCSQVPLGYPVVDSDNVLWFYFYSTADGDLYRTYWNGSTWSTSETVASEGTTTNNCYYPAASLLLDGSVLVMYTIYGGGVIIRNIKDGVIGSAKTIYSSISTQAEYLYFKQLSNGRVAFLYSLSVSPSSNYAYIQHFDRYARIGAGIIESGVDANGNWYRIYGDGWAECGGTYGGTTATSKTADLYWYTPSSKTFPVEFAAAPLLTHSASNYCRSTESGVSATAFVVKAGRGDSGSIGTIIRWRAEGWLA